MKKFHLFHVIFDEYVKLDKAYEYPEPAFRRCHNKECNKFTRFKKHGFYKRYCINKGFSGLISVRRYICPHCKSATISYLPNFCLPQFCYALEIIWKCVLADFSREGTIKACLAKLSLELGTDISRQLLNFYRKRFMSNIQLICLGLRQLNPSILLPSLDTEIKEKAKIVLDLMKNWPGQVNMLSQEFFEKNDKTIFAPNHKLF